MSTVTKYLTKLGAPIPERLAAVIARRQALFEIISAEPDALGPARLAIIQGRPAEEIADLLLTSARHSDQRTRALALLHEATNTLDYAENTATKEAGDEIIDSVRPIFAEHIGRLAEVVYVLGPAPDGELASRTAAGSAAWSTHQEVHPALEATRRLRAALASVGFGHPAPGMAAWVAPSCIETAGDWGKVNEIGDRAWSRLVHSGATVQLNTRTETAELLAKVEKLPPATPPLTPADAVANRRAEAEVNAADAAIKKARKVVKVQ